MWRERIQPREIVDAIYEIDRLKPARVGRTWSARLSTWRADMCAEGAGQPEIESELARAYAVAWTQSMAMRRTMPTPSIVEAQRASAAARGGRLSGPSRAPGGVPRVTRSAVSDDFLPLRNQRSTAMQKRARALARLPSIVQKRELADLLELSPRHIQRLGERGVLERTDRGQYRLSPSLAGYLRYVKADAERRAGTGAEDELRLARIAALAAKAARADRGLIAADEAVAVVDRLAAIFADSLATLPAELERSGDPQVAAVVFDVAQRLQGRRAELIARLS